MRTNILIILLLLLMPVALAKTSPTMVYAVESLGDESSNQSIISINDQLISYGYEDISSSAFIDEYDNLTSYDDAVTLVVKNNRVAIIQGTEITDEFETDLIDIILDEGLRYCIIDSDDASSDIDELFSCNFLSEKPDNDSVLTDPNFSIVLYEKGPSSDAIAAAEIAKALKNLGYNFPTDVASVFKDQNITSLANKTTLAINDGLAIIIIGEDDDSFVDVLSTQVKRFDLTLDSKIPYSTLKTKSLYDLFDIMVEVVDNTDNDNEQKKADDVKKSDNLSKSTQINISKKDNITKSTTKTVAAKLDCMDTDEGKDYSTKGVVVLDGEKVLTDTCKDNMTLMESFCNDGKAEEEEHQCEVCQKGACLKSCENCNDSDACTKDECIDNACKNTRIKDGCSVNDKCIDYGKRIKKEYCDAGVLNQQKDADAACISNFECISNKCTEQKCEKQGLFGSIFSWFLAIFS